MIKEYIKLKIKQHYCQHSFGAVIYTYWDNVNCVRVGIRICSKCGKRQKFM